MYYDYGDYDDYDGRKNNKMDGNLNTHLLLLVESVVVMTLW